MTTPSARGTLPASILSPGQSRTTQNGCGWVRNCCAKGPQVPIKIYHCWSARAGAAISSARPSWVSARVLAASACRSATRRSRRQIPSPAGVDGLGDRPLPGGACQTCRSCPVSIDRRGILRDSCLALSSDGEQRRPSLRARTRSAPGYSRGGSSEAACGRVRRICRAGGWRRARARAHGDRSADYH